MHGVHYEQTDSAPPAAASDSARATTPSQGPPHGDCHVIGCCVTQGLRVAGPGGLSICHVMRRHETRVYNEAKTR